METNKIATFKNSVDVLIRAYLNDTLEHGNCYACAVGNLVSDAYRLHYTKCLDRPVRFANKENNGFYDNLNRRNLGGDWLAVALGVRNKGYYHGIEEINAIGYSISDVARIEKAFEDAEKGDSNDDHMYNGLVAVFEVLADIHGVSLEEKNEAVGMLVK